MIRELAKCVPGKSRNAPEVRDLESWGCRTTMHVVRLIAPRIDGEDQMKDIDFTPGGIRSRREAGYLAARRVIALAPWRRPADPLEGLIVHEATATPGHELARGVDGFAGRTR